MRPIVPLFLRKTDIRRGLSSTISLGGLFSNGLQVKDSYYEICREKIIVMQHDRYLSEYKTVADSENRTMYFTYTVTLH
jgi:hypothetical protein